MPDTLQLQVTLKYSTPRIWRRLRVSSDATLAELHHTLQLCMGWSDAHLHCFRGSQGQVFGDPEQDPDKMFDWIDEGQVRLGDVLVSGKDSLNYDYDFGDGWEHEIRLEKRLPALADEQLPRCLHAVGFCPPEDVGGIPGFAEFLQALNDPQHPEHEHSCSWWGSTEFPQGNPAVDQINTQLAALGGVGHQVHRRNAQSLDDFAGLSPNAVHALLYQTFDCPELLQWQAPNTAELCQQVPLLRMLASLLDALGDQGVKLTARGNLPLAVVRAMLTAGDPQQLSRYPEALTSIRSELDCVPVHFAHVMADLCGLVQVRKGRLLARKRFVALGRNNQWGTLYLELLECILRTFNWAWLDHYDDCYGIRTTAPFMFWLLQCHAGDWREEGDWLEDWLRAFPTLPMEARDRPYQSAREQVIYAMGHRLFSLFQWLGLVEQQAHPSSRDKFAVAPLFMVRATPLLGQLARFNIPPG